MRFFQICVVISLAVAISAIPAPRDGPVIVALKAEELPVTEINDLRLNMGKVLDKTLSKISVAEFIHMVQTSVEKSVKPIVDSLGKFSIRQFINELNKRNKDTLANIHEKGDKIVQKVIEETKKKIPVLKPKDKVIVIEEKPIHHYRKKRSSTEESADVEAVEIEGGNDSQIHDEEDKDFQHDEAVQQNEEEELHQNEEEELQQDEASKALEVFAELVQEDENNSKENDAVNEIDFKMGGNEDDSYVHYSEPIYSTKPKPNQYHFVPVEVHTTPKYPALEKVHTIIKHPAPEKEEFTLPELADQFMKWVRSNFLFRLRPKRQ